MRFTPHALMLAFAVVALAGCGGGSSSSSSSSGGSSAPSQPQIAGIATPKAVSVVTTN